MIFYQFSLYAGIFHKFLQSAFIVCIHFLFFVFFCLDILLFFNNSLQIGKTLLQIDVFPFTFFKTFLSNIDIKIVKIS